MPKIACLQFTLRPQLRNAVSTAAKDISAIAGRLPSVRPFKEAVEFVGGVRPQRSRSEWMSFRLDDFPTVQIAWRWLSKDAAVAVLLRDGVTERLHLLLGGTSVAAKTNAENEPILCAAGANVLLPKLASKEFPVLVSWKVLTKRDQANGPSSILAFIFLMPLFCECCRID